MKCEYSKDLEISRKSLRKAKFDFIERLYFFIIPTAYQRVKWLKKKNKLALLGDHVHWQPRKYPNAIVAAGSLVNKDVPPGTVVAGVPARVIGNFDDLRKKRVEYTKRIRSIDVSKLDNYYWQHFYEERK